ncbi:MAG: hypothetical protein H7339_17070 [Arcicella sp.]|nr:hypothetical protein [Arcicella sp.]
MKNKKSIYILLPIVLLIWGSVAYKFFYFSENKVKSKEANVFTSKPVAIKPRDTSSINVNYRDPFLGKMYSSNLKNVGPKRSTKATKPELPKTPIVLQRILYKGIVSDTKDKTRVFMLIINGRTFLMKKGDTEIEVFLKEGSRESVTVKNKGTLQTIPLQV